MSSNDKNPSGQMSRKERRAAERAARKSGGSSAKSSSSVKSSGSGGSSGPSIAIISIGAVAIGIVLVVALLLVSGGLGDDVAAVEEPDTPAPAAELRDGLTLVAEGATPPVTIEVYRAPRVEVYRRRPDGSGFERE